MILVIRSNGINHTIRTFIISKFDADTHLQIGSEIQRTN
jgi:hypothetical protein